MNKGLGTLAAAESVGDRAVPRFERTRDLGVVPSGDYQLRGRCAQIERGLMGTKLLDL